MDKRQNFQIGIKSLGWSYVAQFFQYGTALLILPLILNRLSSDEMALWYLFLSILSIVGLVDFGFSPSLSKQVSFVYSGARSVEKEGVITQDSFKGIDCELLNDVYRTCKSIYRKISIVIGGLLITFGSIYIIEVTSNISCDLIISWIMFVVSIIYNFYFNYILIFIRGRGLIEEQNKILIISKGAQILTLFVFVLCGLGLLSLVISNFISTFIMREMGKRIMLDDNEKREIDRYDSYKDLTSTIWYNAKRFGIASLGVVLLAQSNIFLSGLYLSLDSVARLGLTIQIFTILTVVSRVMLSSYGPKFSFLFVNNEIKNIRSLFIKCQLVGYFIYISGSAIVFIYGNELLTQLIHSKTLLPQTTVLLLYFLFYLMELTHGNCVTLISYENKVPYYKAGLISGITSIISTFIYLYLGMDIYSFPLGLVTGSLPYNSWKWPYVVLKRLAHE